MDYRPYRRTDHTITFFLHKHVVHVENCDLFKVKRWHINKGATIFLCIFSLASVTGIMVVNELPLANCSGDLKARSTLYSTRDVSTNRVIEQRLHTVSRCGLVRSSADPIHKIHNEI